MSGDAPFHATLADGPEGGRAHWLHAADGVRIRVGVWPCAGLNGKGAKGTVILLPGRTEYIEKYGRTAADLAAQGYATVSVDWRGQGLADRPLADRMSGHVGHFDEYQLDLDEVLNFARAEGFPQPFHMIAHSMGGCIGLRGLMRGVGVRSAAFSAPMWGILIAAWMRPLAMALSTASRWFAFDSRYAPGTGPRTYVSEAAFSGNSLTTDEGMWLYMREQALAEPGLTLGGPSLGWLQAALTECHALSLLPSPDLPVLCGLGTQEKIVDVAPIHARMARWPKGRLDLYTGAEHEVLMEKPATRAEFTSRAVGLFESVR